MLGRFKQWLKSKKKFLLRKKSSANSKLDPNMILGRPVSVVPVEFVKECGYVPSVLTNAALYIEQHIRTKDIFQIQGNSAVAKNLVPQLTTGKHPRLKHVSVHDVIEAMKTFLVRLPGSLLPESVCDNLIESSDAGNGRCSLILNDYRMNNPDYFPILNFMMKLFRKVAKESAYNNMDARKLATIFVLDVIKPLKMDDTAQVLTCFPSERLQRLPYLIMVVEFLIKNPSLFHQSTIVSMRASPPVSGLTYKRRLSGSRFSTSPAASPKATTTGNSTALLSKARAFQSSRSVSYAGSPRQTLPESWPRSTAASQAHQRFKQTLSSTSETAQVSTHRDGESISVHSNHEAVGEPLEQSVKSAHTINEESSPETDAQALQTQPDSENVVTEVNGTDTEIGSKSCRSPNKKTSKTGSRVNSLSRDSKKGSFHRRSSSMSSRTLDRKNSSLQTLSEPKTKRGGQGLQKAEIKPEKVAGGHKPPVKQHSTVGKHGRIERKKKKGKGKKTTTSSDKLKQQSEDSKVNSVQLCPAMRFMSEEVMEPWTDSRPDSEDDSLMAKTITSPRVLVLPEPLSYEEETLSQKPKPSQGDPNVVDGSTAPTEESQLPMRKVSQMPQAFHFKGAITQKTDQDCNTDPLPTPEIIKLHGQDLFISQYVSKRDRGYYGRTGSRSERKSCPGIMDPFVSAEPFRRRSPKRRDDRSGRSSSSPPKTSIRLPSGSQICVCLERAKMKQMQRNLAPSNTECESSGRDSATLKLTVTECPRLCPMVQYKKKLIELAKEEASSSAGWFIDLLLVSISLFCTCVVFYVYSNNRLPPFM